MRAELQRLSESLIECQGRRPLVDHMILAYDEYFRSGVYADRYPVANQHSLNFILDHGGREARRILDYGCGTGRYVLALLEATAAHVTGFDVSAAAIEALDGYLAGNPHQSRAEAVHGSLEDLDGQEPYDVIICMFGVLSHIPRRRTRIHTLSRLRALLTPGTGQLVISVPNVYRRRLLENLQRRVQLLFGNDPTGGTHETGDILYKRPLRDHKVDLFYHLYTPQRFEADLREAGFRDVRLSPESVFSEAAVTHSRLLRGLDAALLGICPISLGYDLLASAR